MTLRSSSILALASISIGSISLASFASHASAQVPLENGLGGVAGYGTSCLGPNDDGSSRAIDLTPIFPSGIQFFDRTHTTMFVNTNGNVSFGDGVAAYTPSAFPIANQPMIAPFWADVDLRDMRTCSMYPDGSGRPEYAYAGDCMSPADDGVWWQLDVARRRVVVTWDRVGYFQCHTDQRMSFQLILTAVGGESCGGGGDFDVEFRFNRCEWSTGDASGGLNGDPRDPAACVRIGPRYVCPIGGALACGGGMDRTCRPVPAQAGFDAGNLADFVEIMGSRTAAIATDLCTMSNVTTPGLWQFQIRSGVVECPDAGGACDTGMPGVCATGRNQCVGGGRECRPEVPSSPEICDGLDNDCNGSVDDGTLCGALEICDRGVCLGTCFEGGCAVGEVCTPEGRCVDAGCETATCPAGERCVAGGCVAACDGITCPAGQECRAGRCIDLCAGAVCDECTVCAGGDCVPRCDFAACPAGQTCLADGSCVESACAGVTCDAGFVCRAGACVDACAGTTCPTGERCELGMCVGAERPDGGTPVGVDGGPLTMIDGGGTIFDAGVPPGVDGGGSVPPGGSSDGCGCRVGMPARSSMAPLLLGLALVMMVARRRRR